MARIYWISLLLMLLWSCDEDMEKLKPVAERKAEAIEDLKDELTDPANGWKISYQPAPTAGTFFILMDFDEDGNVTLQSDLSANEGEFYEQTIGYRIDADQGLELILENYGVFHYLFELNSASFGAEFEFRFIEENDGELIFASKSDVFDETILTLQPATPNDAALLSQEEVENFDQFAGMSPRLFGVQPVQQLYFGSIDYSLFWSIDLTARTLTVDFGGTGSDAESVLASSDYQEINQTRGYTFLNGQLVLSSPVSIKGGTLSSIALKGFEADGGELLCSLAEDRPPRYQVEAAGLGAGVLDLTLFSNSGLDFTPQAQGLYSVNIPFIFDKELNSLAEEGSIKEQLPEAVAFIMTYGLEHDSIPANAMGFLVEDEEENGFFFLRSFEVTNQVANKLEFNLTDEYYYETDPTPEQEQAMESITNEIFEGGQLYAFLLPIRGLTAFDLYNPCNGYELVVVK
ncbi:DUF4302 domain-containing protein [Marinoscillum furvescens]|uniref:Uncharacterized protein DUF4302 n=1 Tax=Marinoscillum furvescens DSM 4134 TaxID=1122208 RepID=A0A3D9L2B8_MARFU|nr:DUF4302 domain-containing protein [Marinoscillum furvescens]RED98889.1 uncharacterized protein DUF4302 [Marinoscillum furvescens DSM 4134]